MVEEPAQPSPRAYGARKRRMPLPKQSQVFFFLILALMLYLTWQVFRDFLVYIITGVFVAVIALPIDKFWERFFPNQFAAVCTMTTLAVIMVVPIFLLGVAMANDVTKLANSVNSGEAADLLYNATQKPWVDRLITYMHPGNNITERHEFVRTQIQVGQDWSVDQLRQFGQDLFEAIPDFFVGFSVILFVVYYVLTDGERFVAYLRRALPIPARQVDFLLHEARNGLSSVFLGQILTSAMQGALGGIGFWIFGLPNAVLWGFVMAIVALLPVVGTFLVWVPGGVYLIITDKPVQGILELLWGFFVVMVFMDNFVKPKMIGKKADIHPMFVLVGVLGGAAAFGFIGLFLGPLLVGVTIAVLKVYEADYLDPEVNLIDEYEAPPPQLGLESADPDTAPDT